MAESRSIVWVEPSFKPTYQLMDSWGVSTFGLFWIMLLWASMYKFFVDIFFLGGRELFLLFFFFFLAEAARAGLLWSLYVSLVLLRGEFLWTQKDLLWGIPQGVRCPGGSWGGSVEPVTHEECRVRHAVRPWAVWSWVITRQMPYLRGRAMLPLKTVTSSRH